MKIKILTTSIVAVFVILSATSSFAQEKMKGMKMMKDNPKMSKMMKSPHHKMMKAYRHNILTFAKTLRSMAKEGGSFDAKFASDGAAEIARSSKMMDKIHKNHMSKMKASNNMNSEKSKKMAPMMKKMKQRKVALDHHIAALKKSVDAGNRAGVEQHASDIVKMLGKKHKGKMKMDKKHKDKMKMDMKH